jgi:hypothetical protein
MKSLSLILLVIFSSCLLIPSEEVKSPVIKNTTTLQIQNKITLFPKIEYIDGSLWEVQINCFCGETLVVYEISPVLTGTTSPRHIIPDSCDKVNVSWKFAPIKSQYYSGVANCRRYLEGQQTVIKDSNTLLIVDQNWSATPGF